MAGWAGWYDGGVTTWRAIWRGGTKLLRTAGNAGVSARAVGAVGLVVGCAWGLGTMGCSSPKGLDSPDPGSRLEAVVQAADERDERAIPDLVIMLRSDDPRQRMLAAAALERITGERRGYDFAAPAWKREDATVAWERYAAERFPNHDRAMTPVEEAGRPGISGVRGGAKGDGKDGVGAGGTENVGGMVEREGGDGRSPGELGAGKGRDGTGGE